MSLEAMMREADAGDAETQYRLGMLLLTGTACEQNWYAAHRWLLRASANGYPGARELAEKLTRWVAFEEKLQSDHKTALERMQDRKRMQDRFSLAVTALDRWLPRLAATARALLPSSGRGKNQRARPSDSRERMLERKAVQPKLVQPKLVKPKLVKPKPVKPKIAHPAPEQLTLHDLI